MAHSSPYLSKAPMCPKASAVYTVLNDCLFISSKDWIKNTV